MRAGRWEKPPLLYREFCDPLAVISERGVTDNEETSGTLFANSLEGPVHIVTSRPSSSRPGTRSRPALELRASRNLQLVAWCWGWPDSTGWRSERPTERLVSAARVFSGRDRREHPLRPVTFPPGPAETCDESVRTGSGFDGVNTMGIVVVAVFADWAAGRRRQSGRRLSSDEFMAKRGSRLELSCGGSAARYAMLLPSAVSQLVSPSRERSVPSRGTARPGIERKPTR